MTTRTSCPRKKFDGGTMRLEISAHEVAPAEQRDLVYGRFASERVRVDVVELSACSTGVGHVSEDAVHGRQRRELRPGIAPKVVHGRESAT
jgi:hypothetical protein